MWTHRHRFCQPGSTSVGCGARSTRPSTSRTMRGLAELLGWPGDRACWLGRQTSKNSPLPINCQCVVKWILWQLGCLSLWCLFMCLLMCVWVCGFVCACSCMRVFVFYTRVCRYVWKCVWEAWTELIMGCPFIGFLRVRWCVIFSLPALLPNLVRSVNRTCVWKKLRMCVCVCVCKYIN